MAALHGAMVRRNALPTRTRSTIKVPRNDVMGVASSSGSINGVIPNEGLRSDVRNRFDEIRFATTCDIAILSNEPQSGDSIHAHSLETERHAEIAIEGQFECVEQAKVSVMVALDELSGLHSEVCEIDYKLHNILGGRKRCVVQTIQEETATNIYFPTPFPGVLSTNINPAIASRQNAIYITGEFYGVQRARDMLFQVSMHRSKSIISRNTAVLPRKIDWLVTERLEELRSIMIDNATFIHLPTLGSQTSLLTVYGDSRVSIERSIRSVMQLACQFFVASVWLLPISFDGITAPVSLTPAQVAPILKVVGANSGAEINYKGNSFELHGVEEEVRSSITLLLDLDLLKTFNLEIRFQIELANEHREFISGKKNGKINKIMKQGVRIKFETFNDYNFLIDVSSNDRTGTLQGLTLLLEELPAEMSFHIPENYHKRIIGVGGKNIQKTMKKYGVYVKFYSKQDLDVETYPFIDAEDNVIARTPAKNSVNLDNLKAAVMELVNPKDKDFVAESVPIARRYHRTLLGQKGIFIHEIEGKLGCTIRFPPPESANDLVSIFGPESQIHIAAQMLLDHVPFEADFRAPDSQELNRLLGSQDFAALVERVKRDLNIQIVPVTNSNSSPVPDSASQGHSSPPATDVVFKLRLNRSSTDFLPAARDALEDFLISRNIHVYRSPERTRTDSFASSFHHFANKLISVPQAAESTDSFQTDPQARFNRQALYAAAHQQQEQFDMQENNRLRAAASTPDIKALFDSPSMASGPFIPPSMPFNPNFTGNNGSLASMHSHNNNATSTGTPASAISTSMANKSNFYTSPYQDALRMATGLGGRSVWSALTRFSKPSHNVRSSPAPVDETSTTPPEPQLPVQDQAPSSIVFPQHNTRLSDDVGMMHSIRAADKGDTGLEDHMNTLRKSRAYAHRAQSLDIGALAAQQVVQQASTQANASGVVGLTNGLRLNGSNTSGSISSAADVGVPSSAASSYSPSYASSGSAAQRPFGAIGSKPVGSQMHRVGASNSFSDATTQQQNSGSNAFGSMGGPTSQSQHAAHHSLPPSYGGVPLTHFGQFSANNNLPPQQSHLSQQSHDQQKQTQHQQPQRQAIHQAQLASQTTPAFGNHGHHLPSPSISRLAPSTLQRGPGPETADEVLRSLEQLHFQSSA